MGGRDGRDLKRILTDHGYRFVRDGKGDREIRTGPINGLHFTVDPGSRNRFTANGTFTQPGIEPTF